MGKGLDARFAAFLTGREAGVWEGAVPSAVSAVTAVHRRASGHLRSADPDRRPAMLRICKMGTSFSARAPTRAKWSPDCTWGLRVGDHFGHLGLAGSKLVPKLQSRRRASGGPPRQRQRGGGRRGAPVRRVQNAKWGPVSRRAPRQGRSGPQIAHEGCT